MEGNRTTAKECTKAFCRQMNKKALELGMHGSTFNDPAGIFNCATPKDILTCLLKVCDTPLLCKLWQNERYTVNVEGANAREMPIVSKVFAGDGSADLCAHYKLLGGKGGSLTRPGIYNTAVVVEGPAAGERLACVIMGAEAPGTQPGNRFAAAKAALDVALGRTAPDAHVCADSALVCVVPEDKGRQAVMLYEKAPVKANMPASMSKMLTALVVLDVLHDVDTRITVTQDDVALVAPGFYQEDFRDGDIVSVKDLLAAMLLPSSNVAAHILGRYVGQILLDEAR
ncbi:MAG: serine hydrolase [Clostridia bacterium]|nr:serine hydrolase [Clostridia bacterium]